MQRITPRPPRQPEDLTLLYSSGTLTATGPNATGRTLPPDFVWDERTRLFRAPASAYRKTVLSLRESGTAHADRAADFANLALESRLALTLRPYQTEALAAWRRAGLRGVVVLPTGAGKTALALAAMERTGRSTLIVVPTLALLKQWYSVLTDAFGVPVGLLGGGYHEVEPITVTTYDSAYIHAERYGDRFALVVYDEVHHLPAPKNAVIPSMLLAPYALGLTATPERPDGGHERLDELAGPVVYRKRPEDLAGEYLAPYELVRIPVELTAHERHEYALAEAVYRDFLEKHRLPMRSPEDWQRFIMVAATSHSGGREALLAARRRRDIQLNALRKGATLESLLRKHWDDRTIVFTKSVEEVYSLSKRLLVPAITFETPAKERKEILDRFRDGRYRAVIASDVLNEGVDVPEAGVAVVLAGSASHREYVQRLGRILRPKEGKRAVLYELVTSETGEESTARRRREAFASAGSNPGRLGS
ncbi:DNA or RNA helicases of superfamily II [Rubrobacter radiotolerans]|uniref:DNA 3'-5' helicase n=1 Tax=Rubrobacter radiotolerans TaxID=42256 RepID=A0A023X515_RUBRA|nr:DEAD/DEAH box helicase family protein [Rubrobacter radiotolerans]AHY47055.1 DNA or RNA helicases of superfamily II [Rubrobacter radiotolerans]MDX5894461.1 DEAD/DEAH box helicase family protein [Rubrobacter radiotolerans]SMC06053.1 Superfamily II DNA or RNA helicase [Rubrobacter radiotolerans DSM 5868]